MDGQPAFSAVTDDEGSCPVRCVDLGPEAARTTPLSMHFQHADDVSEVVAL